MKGRVRRERSFDTAESETLGMWGSSLRENREVLQTPTLDGSAGRSKKAKGRNVDMHVCRESDGLIVPRKRANKAGAEALQRSPQREGGRPRGTHHKRTRTGHRAGDASHRGWGAYGKPYPNEAAGRHRNPR
jgi:hypothetical protein